MQPFAAPALVLPQSGSVHSVVVHCSGGRQDPQVVGRGCKGYMSRLRLRFQEVMQPTEMFTLQPLDGLSCLGGRRVPCLGACMAAQHYQAKEALAKYFGRSARRLGAPCSHLEEAHEATDISQHVVVAFARRRAQRTDRVPTNTLVAR